MTHRTLAALLGPLLTATLAVTLLATLVGVVPATAAEPLPTTLTLRATQAYAGSTSTLTARLLDDTGEPVPDAAVLLERRGEDGWRELETLTTDAQGRAVADAVLDRTPRTNAFRVRYAGDELHAASRGGPTPVELRRRHSMLQLLGPDSVVDERSITLRVRWQTRQGEGVPGRVQVMRRDGGGKWRRVQRLRTDADGTASFEVTPRTDTRWRARGAGQAWVRADRSGVHAVDNLPPGTPVRLPSAAPRPRIKLPAQRHAVGNGANPVVTRIPDGVWNQMTGISWHSGCPVGRAGLRLVRVNYWDYSGYRRRGEMVVNADVAGRVSGALAAMYARDLPIRAMYRVDRFGYSARVRGGDDHASMAAGNSSGFNCRDVVNRPGVRSPHSYGRSIDLNTWENPYRSATGLVPNTWWQSRSHPRVAWRSSRHAVVQVMANHGIRWTYGLDDTQHFDARPAGLARPLPVPDCGDVACE